MEAAYIATRVELTPTRRGPFNARVIRLELDRLWLQRVHESAPRIKWAAQSANRVFIRFQANIGPEPVTDGVPLRRDQLMYHCRGHSYHEHTLGPSNWGAVSLPVEDMATATIAIAGRDLSLPSEPRHIVPSAKAMSRLQRLHADAAALVQAAPHVLEVAEVAHGLEQSLVEAVIDCLTSHDGHELTWAQRCHDTVMRRFRRVLEAEPDRAFYVPEISTAIGVPERTLRVCCHEHLRMSPKQYLLLRRMHQVQRVLRASSHAETTVTDVATRFGFWHFGRFAGSYRQIFGEPPSVTLARPV
jgi:AraC-like DNA-binding protein